MRGAPWGANSIACNAFMTTNTAVAAAGLTWSVLEWIRNGKPTIFGTLTGTIAGLATITPASGFVTVLSAVIIGIVASVVCYIAVGVVKPRLGYDDSLDAFGVHGVGGIIGTLMVGFFATKTVNSSGANGFFYGSPKQLLIQLFAVGVVFTYTLVVSFVLYKLVDLFMRVRVSEKEELMGLDLTQHRERAYTVLE